MSFFRKNKIQIITLIGLFVFFFGLTRYYHGAKSALIISFFDTFMLFTVYITTVYYLFPRYYTSTKRYLTISIPVILTFIIVFFLFDIKVLAKFRLLPENLPPLIFYFMRFFTTNGFVFFIATSVSLINHNNELKQKEKQLAQEKIETELKLLKAQINPHFIFNALNNIYSLTYLQSKTAPESVLKLSEMLRYVFYDCSKDHVTVESEVKYIENFNAFQQMKSEQDQNILLEYNIKENNLVAPMLFIPFIENAFKYSRIEDNKNAFVTMKISSTRKKIDFCIENSISVGNIPSPGSGMGIKNVQNRLAIVYPNAHKLTISQENNRYVVILSIDI